MFFALRLSLKSRCDAISIFYGKDITGWTLAAVGHVHKRSTVRFPAYFSDQGAFNCKCFGLGQVFFELDFREASVCRFQDIA